MAVFLVTSADVGAPSMTGVNGAGVAVTDFIMSAAGISPTYTGTNKRVYTMGNGDVIRFVHDSAVTGNAQFMIMRCAESATDVDTLVDAFPTTAQVSDSLCNIRTSASSNSTARPWWAIVDNSATTGCFYLFIDFNAASGVSGGWWAGGTACSAVPTDNYSSLCYTRATSSTSTGAANNACFQFIGSIPNGAARLYLKRSADGVIKSSLSTGTTVGGNSAGGYVGVIDNGPAIPHPVDGKIRMTDVSVTDLYSTTVTPGSNTEACRMWIPRMFQPLHNSTGYSGIDNGDTWADSSYGASAKFIFFKGASTGAQGAVVIQYDGTWTSPNG